MISGVRLTWDMITLTSDHPEAPWCPVSAEQDKSGDSELTNQRTAWSAMTNQRKGINHRSCEYLWWRSFYPPRTRLGYILSLKLNKILILHGSKLWKGWRDLSLMKTSQSTIGRSWIHDHLLLTKIKFKYFPRVTKYSFSIWFATSRLWVICVNILSHLCLFLCPGLQIVTPLATIRWSHDVTPDISAGCYNMLHRVRGETAVTHCRGRPHCRR